MSEAKHTPGPWYSAKARFDRRPLEIPLRAWNCEKLGFSIAFVNGHKGAEAEANAHLISAAPDLLEAVKRLLGCMDVAGWHDDDAAHVGRAAIARATGKGE